MRILFTCSTTGTITVSKLVKQWIKNGIYGALYNHYAVVDTREIAPDGWHVPTTTEYTTLFNYLGDDTTAGGYLKTIGTDYWDSPNTGATNSVGFDARGSGFRNGSTGVFAFTKQLLHLRVGDTTGWNIKGHVSIAHNSIAIGYAQTFTGGESIRLLKDDSTDPGTMTDQDGNTYDTVKIGDQVWMKQNLMTTHFNSGVEGSVAYGYLYNYYVLSSIAGSGWHVPSWTEFISLANQLGGSTVAGGYMKETGTTYWDSPNEGADNSSGFNGRGCGNRNGSSGLFFSTKGICSYASTYNSGGTWVIPRLSAVNDDLTWASTAYNSTGVTIRLIKDNSTDSGKYTGNDGKEYATVKIGSQVWMAHDLMETKYNDGSSIPTVTDNTTWAGLTTGAKCAYNNTQSNAGVEPLSSEIPGASSTFSNSAWAALTTAGMCWYNDDSDNGYTSSLEVIDDSTVFEVTVTGQGANPATKSGNVDQDNPLTLTGLKFDEYEITETAVTGYTFTQPDNVTLSAGHKSESVEITNTKT